MPTDGRGPAAASRGADSAGPLASAASPPTSAEFIARADEAFEVAFRRAGSTSWLRIAGRGICVQFAGDRLRERLLPALRARSFEGETGPAALTIRAWDSAATGVALPARPWDLDDDRVRGNLRARAEGGARVHFQPGSDTFSAFERHSSRALFWTRDARLLPAWEEASPFRTLFHWWSAAQSMLLVHGAAVGTAAGAALLAGRGGSGKSTAAVACLAAGMRFAGDDYVIVADDPEPVVYNVFGTAKLDPVHGRRFSELARFTRWPRRADLNKEILDLTGQPPDLVPERQPLSAILAVRVCPDAPTSVEPASASRALAALAPSTLLQLPQTDASALALLTRIARRVPAGVLSLGTDLASAPAAIAEFLSRLPSPRS